MKDFNEPGSNKTELTPEFKNFVTELQLDNVCKILGGELKHYVCTDRNTIHRKIVIEYDHQEKCKH